MPPNSKGGAFPRKNLPEMPFHRLLLSPNTGLYFSKDMPAPEKFPDKARDSNF
jgi:hypothetical protein